MADASPHIDDDQLALLMAGALASDRLEALEEHVDRCPACNELLIRVAQQIEPADEVAPERLTIGRYQIARKLGAGGMGVVYAAFDPNLRRDVALKLVRNESGDATLDRQRTERLLREAHALAALSHPNIVAVFDAGVVDGQLFIATELVQGRTVTQWVLEEAPGLDEILRVYTQVGEALAAAHRAGIVHRDVKPDNILIGDDGRVRLVDFGLATEGGRTKSRVRALASTIAAGSNTEGGVRFAKGSNEALTVTGAVMGTPLYMAPEQLLGPTSDPRSDQFAFCVSLYESRYRKRPFAGTTMAELADNVLAGNLRDVELASPAARRLHAVIARGLSPEPDHRYSSMEELLAELRALAHPASRPRWLLWALAAVLVGGAVAVVAGVSARKSASAGVDAGAAVAAAAGAKGDAGASASATSDAAAEQPALAPVDARPEGPTNRAASRAPAKTRARAPVPASHPPRTPPKGPSATAPSRAEAMTRSAAHVSRASQLILSRDPGCRAALKKAALGVVVFDTRLLEARCHMVAGACAKGIEQARKFMLSKGTGAIAAKQDAEREARMFCSTSKGSWGQRLARLSVQVHVGQTSRALSRRFARDLAAVARSAGGAMARADRIAVYNAARTLAEALVRFGECPKAVKILRLGVDLYLGPGQPLTTGAIPQSAALKACLSQATP